MEEGRGGLLLKTPQYPKCRGSKSFWWQNGNIGKIFALLIRKNKTPQNEPGGLNRGILEWNGKNGMDFIT